MQHVGKDLSNSDIVEAVWNFKELDRFALDLFTTLNISDLGGEKPSKKEEDLLVILLQLGLEEGFYVAILLDTESALAESKTIHATRLCKMIKLRHRSKFVDRSKGRMFF